MVLFICDAELKAQLTQWKPIDVLTGLNEGTIQATVDPPFTVDRVEKIFDGNPLTEAGVRDDSTVHITLQFSEPIEIAKSRLFPWINGQWSLEVADSLDDLNTQSGSYQLLVSDQSFTAFVWDSVRFSPVEAKVIRLTAKNLQSSGVYIGEWEIYTSITLTSLRILPQPLKLIPGTSLQLEVELVDAEGRTYPYNLDEPVRWSSSNPEVASVGEMGDIHAHSLGTTVITARTTALVGTTTAHVVSDFESPKAEPLVIKVALVLQDPVIDSTRMRKIHQVRGWADPRTLANQLVEEFSRVSDGVVRFQIVEMHDDGKIFSRLDGKFMTVDTLAYFFSSLSRLYGREVEGTLQNLAEKQGRVRFDYNAMIDYYDFDTKRNSGVIDEVWVYAYPFASLYESILAGPNAFWWNAPPLDHPGLEKLLSIMGLNYERGIAEAMHSFGHRAESAMRHAYGRWDVHAEKPNNWELFTTIDKDKPGKAHVGNIHFPPNGMSDYDYSNRRYVISYADNWKRYPILLDQRRSINCSEWGCSHLGYMRWWFSHLPRYRGVTDGILNNWWHYVVDYEGAVEKARRYTGVKDKSDFSKLPPGAYSLGQNYPNPFNLLTKISFSLARPQRVTLKVYDVLGREVKTIVDGWKPAGRHEVKFDGRGLASGVYFYKLTAGDFSETKKFLLIK